LIMKTITCSLSFLVAAGISPCANAFHISKQYSSNKNSAAVVATSTRRMLVELDAEANHQKKRVVVVGNGMVGQRFMENLIQQVGLDNCQISTFCEEPRAAYNRVKLTSYFETRNPSDLSMTSEFDENGKTVWYDANGVELFSMTRSYRWTPRPRR
jgi:hypothetical protein